VHPHADFVFLSAPLSVDGAQKLIERLGKLAELPFPTMLDDACGMRLVTPQRPVESMQATSRLSWGID
jgi:hypothetical protein